MVTIKCHRDRLASLWIDPQATFSCLYPQQLPVAGAAYIVKPLLAQRALAAPHLAFSSQDLHSPKHLWRDDQRVGQPSQLGEDAPHHWNNHAEIATPSAEFLAGLPRHFDLHNVVKGTDPDSHGYGAFFNNNPSHADQINLQRSTGLYEKMLYQLRQGAAISDQQLKADAVLIIGGLALDYCVKETALQARYLGFQTVIVNLAATRAIDYPPHTAREAIKTMLMQGVRFYTAPALPTVSETITLSICDANDLNHDAKIDELLAASYHDLSTNLAQIDSVLVELLAIRHALQKEIEQFVQVVREQLETDQTAASVESYLFACYALLSCLHSPENTAKDLFYLWQGPAKPIAEKLIAIKKEQAQQPSSSTQGLKDYLLLQAFLKLS